MRNQSIMPPERGAAYGVVVVVLLLLLPIAWPGGGTSVPAAPPAQAAPIVVPTPALISLVATPAPAALSMHSEAPAAQRPAVTSVPEPTPAPAAPTEERAPVVAADAVVVSEVAPPPPASQIIYEADGSLRLPGVDGPAIEANPPTVAPMSAAQQAALAADAALYTSLPVAKPPSAENQQPARTYHGCRGGGCPRK